jgi:Tol biopolymer transport system component
VVAGLARDGGRGLFRINAQTGETTALLLSGPGERIAWKALTLDGKSMFYGSRSNGKFSIVVINLQSGEKKIVYGPTEDLINNLAISPDGKWLAFRWQRQAGSLPHPAAIMVMPTSGGEPRELVHVKDESLLQGGPSEGGRRGHAWTPNGQYLLFSMRPDKNIEEYDLWRVPGDGGTPQKLELRMNALAIMPMHPDGHQIMFVAGTRGREEVWVMENFLPKQSQKEHAVVSRKR